MHALLGENGAGKSTLMNILYGLYKPDEGEILLERRSRSRSTPPKDAIDARDRDGAPALHADPGDDASPRTSCSRSSRRKAGVLLDYGKAPSSASASSRPSSASPSTPTAKVESISVGQQQRVEILKALYRGADILILDEPTAVLTPQEAGELFEIIRSLQAEGTSIIFISHKLNEVLEIADRITVLRRGKKIDTVPREGATEDGLARMMVGREVLLRVDKKPAEPGDVLLEVRDLQVDDDRGLPRGPRRLARRARRRDRRHRRRRRQRPERADRGDHRPAPPGERARSRSPARGFARERAARCSTRASAHIPEDRQRRGLVLEFSIAENIALHDYRNAARLAVRAGSSRGGSSSGALALIKEFDVRGGGPQTRAARSRAATSRRSWSRGRSRATPRCSIAAQPTRGLDVGAIEYVHRRLVDERDEGRAILLVSLELDEVLSLSDRILVIYEGEIVGEHEPGVTEEEIGLEMLGGRRKETAA